MEWFGLERTFKDCELGCSKLYPACPDTSSDGAAPASPGYLFQGLTTPTRENSFHKSPLFPLKPNEPGCCVPLVIPASPEGSTLSSVASAGSLGMSHPGRERLMSHTELMRPGVTSASCSPGDLLHSLHLTFVSTSQPGSERSLPFKARGFVGSVRGSVGSVEG